jgi:hypothetical protein
VDDDCSRSFEQKLSFLASQRGPHKQLVEPFTVRLIGRGLGRPAMWRSLSLLGNLIDLIARIGSKPSDRRGSRGI